jgi:hypothetical protein
VSSPIARWKQLMEKIFVGACVLVNNGQVKKIGAIVYCACAVAWAVLRPTVDRLLFVSVRALIISRSHLILGTMYGLIGRIQQAL